MIGIVLERCLALKKKKFVENRCLWGLAKLPKVVTMDQGRSVYRHTYGYI